MTNQRSKEKQRIEVWFDKKVVLQLDAEAQRLGLSRSEVILAAVREHLGHDPVPASAAQIDEVKAALLALAAKQDAAQKLGEESSAALLSAIRETAPALPAGRKLSLAERIRGRI